MCHSRTKGGGCIPFQVQCCEQPRLSASTCAALGNLLLVESRPRRFLQASYFEQTYGLRGPPLQTGASPTSCVHPDPCLTARTDLHTDHSSLPSPPQPRPLPDSFVQTMAACPHCPSCRQWLLALTALTQTPARLPTLPLMQAMAPSLTSAVRVLSRLALAGRPVLAEQPLLQVHQPPTKKRSTAQGSQVEHISGESVYPCLSCCAVCCLN